MANPNNPHGFQYVSIARPTPPLTRTYTKLSSFTVGIFQNDVVWQQRGTSGFPTQIKSFSDGATLASTVPLGVALNYGGASTQTKHHVISDVDQEFEAQDDDGTTGIVETDIELNAHIAIGSGGSTTTGFSSHQIDKSGATGVPAVTSTYQLQLLRLYPDILNAFGPHARVLCKFRNVFESTAVTAV